MLNMDKINPWMAKPTTKKESGKDPWSQWDY